MPLPPFNEKPLSSLPPKVAGSAPYEVVCSALPTAACPTSSWATPTYRQVLTLCLGLGGMLNALCLPALASPGAAELQENTVTETHTHHTNTHTNVFSAQATTKLSLENYHQDYYPSRSHPLGLSRTLAYEPTLSRRLEKDLPRKPALVSIAPRLLAHSLLATHLSTTEPIDATATLSGLADGASADGNGTIPVSPVQTLSVLDVRNVDLAWEDVTSESVGSWMNEADDSSPGTDPAVSLEGVSLENASSENASSENANPGGTQRDRAEDTDQPKKAVPIAVNQDSESSELDLLSGILTDEGVVAQVWPVLDDELGTLRLRRLRSYEELGILRLMQTAEATAPPPRTRTPVAVLGGRLGYVNVENVFRSTEQIQEQIYQAGLSLYFFPKLSENTSLYAIADTNIARYDTFSDINNPNSRGIQLDYNEVQLQVGIRQRLRPQTYAQIGFRNQQLYSPGYREKLFGVSYIDALVSHRSILNPKVWVDSFYQMRLGFADPREASRFRQTITLSLNYGATRNVRTSLLYQLDFDDYTQVNRYDIYQQLLGIVSYNITPESRVSLFGGTRFGNSSAANIDLNDTFYGAGLNVNVSLF